jgi:hypothetical protein
LAPWRGFRQSKNWSRQGLQRLTGAPNKACMSASGFCEKPSTLSRFFSRCTASDPQRMHRE